MWCQQPKLPLCQILQHSSSARAKHIKQSSVNPITSSEWFVLFLGMVQNIQWQRKRGQDWPDNETRHVLKHNHISCQQPPREAYWMPWRKLLRNSNASEINHDSQKFNQDQEIINKSSVLLKCSYVYGPWVWSGDIQIQHSCICATGCILEGDIYTISIMNRLPCLQCFQHHTSSLHWTHPRNMFSSVKFDRQKFSWH
jgi:hypothetical protein